MEASGGSGGGVWGSVGGTDPLFDVVLHTRTNTPAAPQAEDRSDRLLHIDGRSAEPRHSETDR